jgi:hypothetical protein
MSAIPLQRGTRIPAQVQTAERQKHTLSGASRSHTTSQVRYKTIKHTHEFYTGTFNQNMQKRHYSVLLSWTACKNTQ